MPDAPHLDVSRRLPEGSWDTHCHVFGPATRFPWAADRNYTPAEAPRKKLAQIHAEIGVRHAVIVHPGCHGLDLSVTRDAIAASHGRHRGIALVEETIPFSTLERLDGEGFRGIRFNYSPQLGPVPAVDTVLRLAERIAPLGWHILFHFDPAEIPTFLPIADRLPVPFVIDHIGRIRAEDGLDQNPFRALLDLATDPRCWIKISGADRASSSPPRYEDTLPFVRAIIDAAPSRTLWGTDFPHPNVKGPVPRESDLVDLLFECAPEDRTRRRILIENPAKLYWR